MEVAGTSIPPQLAELLERFRFDRVPFEELRARLRAAAPDPESLHRISEPIEVPAEDVARRLPAPSSSVSPYCAQYACTAAGMPCSRRPHCVVVRPMGVPAASRLRGSRP